MKELPTKLLFIDDDPVFLAAQNAFFGARGFKVLTAEGSAAAIELLSRETPDMIFIDLMMEHMDSGFTLARRIRREERFRTTPMVMLSGVASETGMAFAREREELRSWSHIDDFLDKPVNAHRLLAIVEQRLSINGHGQGDR
ncbi:MAG TPA: response regulator [Acidobacteriota bacterium]|nr:response regulator [Acidobacteriota bacterium]